LRAAQNGRKRHDNQLQKIVASVPRARVGKLAEVVRKSFHRLGPSIGKRPSRGSFGLTLRLQRHMRFPCPVGEDLGSGADHVVSSAKGAIPERPDFPMPADDRRLNAPQSVTRVIQILEALCASARPMSLADLSRVLNTPKSSLAALLRGLSEEDFVVS